MSPRFRSAHVPAPVPAPVPTRRSRPARLPVPAAAPAVLAAALLAAGVLALALLAGCSGDGGGTRPGAPGWSETALPGETRGYLLDGVAFHGSRGLAVGHSGEGSAIRPWLVQTNGGAWTAPDLEAIPRGGGLYAAGFGPDGNAVVAGSSVFFTPLLLDERGGWHEVDLGLAGGGLAAVAATGDSVRVVGGAVGGMSLVRTGAGAWTNDGAGFTPEVEVGLYGLASRDGSFLACGYAGGPDRPVIRRFAAGAWSAVPGPPDSLGDAYYAVLPDADGSLWVGGTRDGRPFLAHRAGGAWTTVSLGGYTAGEVTGLLRTGAGDLLVSLSGASDQVLRREGSGWAVEIHVTGGSAEALAEGPRGSVYAAGWQTLNGEDPHVEPRLWLRTP